MKKRDKVWWISAIIVFIGIVVIISGAIISEGQKEVECYDEKGHVIKELTCLKDVMKYPFMVHYGLGVLIFGGLVCVYSLRFKECDENE